MKDLWRVDNERGYWITEFCDSFSSDSMQWEKLKRTINDSDSGADDTIEISFNSDGAKRS